MSRKLSYGKHSISDEDIHSVGVALESDWLTNGPRAGEFEEVFASRVGAKYAVSVSSGTAALHLAALAMADKASGEKQGTVITTPLTFVASASAFLHAGFDIDLVDIDDNTLNIDPNLLEEKIKEKKGKVRGIVPVHFAGRIADMHTLSRLAHNHGVWTVEDAAHALGAFSSTENGKTSFCGDCTSSAITTFSFHPVKHITTGEGGMITTNDDRVYRAAALFKNHSMDRSTAIQEWEYDVSIPGYNYRLTEMQAALGISQLARLNGFLLRRQALAKRYSDALIKFPIRLPEMVDGHAWHLYIIRTTKRDALFKYLKERNIVCQVHYVPLHKFSYFKKNGFANTSFPIVERYYNECLSLPLYPDLTNEDQDRVISEIESFFQTH